MLAAYLLFLAKTITFIVAILLIIAGIITLVSKGKQHPKERLDIKKLNEKYEAMAKLLREKICTKKQLKQYGKEEKQQRKQNEKLKPPAHRKRIFVLNFQGDIRASAVKTLREEITALLTTATREDEVVLRLESPGGMVYAYGLAASELLRIRHKEIPLTVIVDKVAASGGYMMACVANRILAAPFAIVGSIGVIAQLPNFHRLLKKKDIDFEQIMAGQYKRTLSLFGENTRQGREKFQEEIDETHTLFKAFIRENRPMLNIEKVATGEHWYGKQAISLQLIDDICTSDDYLQFASNHADIYELCYVTRRSLMEKLNASAQKGYENLLKAVSPSHTFIE